MNAPRFFYGWVVVGVSFLSIAFSRGIQLSFAIFFVEMVREFGWSRGSTAFFQSTNLAIAGSLGLVVGLLVDRWGSRKTLLLGCGLYALGLAGASTIASQPALLLWWGVVAGMGSALLGFVPLGVVLSHWFARRRGTAVGLGFAGAGVGTFLLLPATEFFIQVTSWRRAMQVLALLLLVLAPIIARFLRESPQEMGLEPDGEASLEQAATAATVVAAPLRKTTARRRGALSTAEPSQAAAGQREWTLARAVATPPFWFFLAVWLFTSIGMFMIITHQVAQALDRGFDRQAGVFALGIMGLLSAVGRPLFGALSDYIRRELAVSLSFLCSFIGILALTFATAERSGYLLIVYAVFFGLGFGSRGPILSVMLADRFGGRHLGAIYGAASGAGVSLASLFGPWLGGWVFDRTGTYTGAFYFASGVILVAGVCAWLAATYPQRCGEEG